MAFPLWCGGYTEVIMASPVTKIIADPIPCMIREAIRMSDEGDKAQESDATVNMMIP